VSYLRNLKGLEMVNKEIYRRQEKTSRQQKNIPLQGGVQQQIFFFPSSDKNIIILGVGILTGRIKIKRGEKLLYRKYTLFLAQGFSKNSLNYKIVCAD
jgi:hypothetical protein